MKANTSRILACRSCNGCQTRKCWDCRRYKETREIMEKLKKMPRKGLIFSDFGSN